MILVMIIGAFLRLISIFFASNVINYDTLSYAQVGEAVLKGVTIYPTVASAHYPYFPLMLYIFAFACYVSKYGIFYMVFLKLFFSLFDMGIVWLIYLLTKDLKRAFLYSINPISIFVTCIQGQFDAIPLFFLLYAVYVNKSHKNLSYLLLSLAVTIKSWPLAFVLPFLSNNKKLQGVAVIFLVPLLSLFVYATLFHTSYYSIIRSFLFYRGAFGIYGLGFILKLFTANKYVMQGASLIFVIALFRYSLQVGKESPIKQMGSIMLFFFTFTLSFGMQWLIWPIPFLIMTKQKYTLAYNIICTLYFLFIWVSWIFPSFTSFTIYPYCSTIMLCIVWITVLCMFIDDVKENNLKHAFHESS